ncbi:Na(+)/H(+) exchange regulatory cofactor NHE-RF1 [Lepisosteus oculatus]|uniref:Na(+)/H(+) exchange regulatory cofactor NHE-RF n=1 Tax=Lepisosteus oculatus TaxID=7918 RepID=W5MZ63_LEPOC|nr:PREDICTED: Na(+)/H(+) exchange regulatory cofactor NHE-RF1 [Lepisosteus oculatus]
MSSHSESLRPRLCSLEKGGNGYGFHLHGEKGKTGQFIRLVEPDSPAEASGLRAGDRLAFVNGESVESESHQQVVSRIRATTGDLKLIVVDRETDDLLKKYNLKCQPEYVTSGIPIPSESEEEVGENGSRRGSSPTPEKNGDITGEKKPSVSSEKESKTELRPRLCKIKKGVSGYGFNLHSEKSKPGQYIRAVDPDSPAEKSGLLPQDRIVEVNGLSMEGKQHAEVVAAIKAGGEETTLLVVDPDTDTFFKKCKTIPAEAHLTGALPEPVVNGDVEDKANGKVAKEPEPKVSVSPTSSNASSNTSLTGIPASTPTPEVKPAEKESGGDPALSLTMSLQQAKERAHQKRSNKRAPQMDWSKKNELFSNL